MHNYSGNRIGSAVFWTLRPMLHRDKLVAWLDEEGLRSSMLPNTPAPKTVLFAAAHAAAIEYNKFAKREQLPQVKACRVPDTMGSSVQTVAIVSEQWDTTVSHAQYVEAEWNCIATIVRKNKRSCRDVEIKSASHALKSLLQAEYDKRLIYMPQRILSNWLATNYMRKVDGLNLRTSIDRDKKTMGGVYFIPESYMSEWRDFVHALELGEAGLFFEIPMFLDVNARKLLLNALRYEIDQTNKSIVDYVLQRASKGFVFNRLFARIKRMSIKIDIYESILQLPLDDLRALSAESSDLVKRAVPKTNQENIFT